MVWMPSSSSASTTSRFRCTVLRGVGWSGVTLAGGGTMGRGGARDRGSSHPGAPPCKRLAPCHSLHPPRTICRRTGSRQTPSSKSKSRGKSLPRPPATPWPRSSAGWCAWSSSRCPAALCAGLWRSQCRDGWQAGDPPRTTARHRAALGREPGPRFQHTLRRAALPSSLPFIAHRPAHLPHRTSLPFRIMATRSMAREVSTTSSSHPTVRCRAGTSGARPCEGRGWWFQQFPHGAAQAGAASNLMPIHTCSTCHPHLHGLV